MGTRVDFLEEARLVQFAVAALRGALESAGSSGPAPVRSKFVSNGIGVRSLVVGGVDYLGFKIPQSACIDHTDPGPELRPLSMIMHLR
jgi:hypothetical protein